MMDYKQLSLQSADTMQEYAKKYCHSSQLESNPSSCEWYHAAWQYLTALGVIHSPDLHAAFYVQFFTEASNLETYDILISGTADYAILDHLVKAIPQKMLSNVTISILDLCQTPLEICKWYAKRYEDNFNIHLPLKYIQRDAFNTGFKNETFDMITTYSFLSRFSQDKRKNLIKEWHRVLKPNGKIITSDLISPEYKLNKIVLEGGIADKEEGVVIGGQVDELVLRAMRHVDENKLWLRSPRNTIRNLVYEYAKSYFTYSLPSEEYIYQLLDNFNCVIKSGFTSGDLTGDPENYASIMAVKK